MIAIAATHTIAWKIIVNLFVALSLLVDHTMIASCQMTRVQYIYISVCVYYIYISKLGMVGWHFVARIGLAAVRDFQGSWSRLAKKLGTVSDPFVDGSRFYAL